MATPSGAHMEPAIRAAEAGKHVVVEKPLEITLERCDRIIAACERRGDSRWQALQRGRDGRRDAEGLVDPDWFVHRAYEADERLPWDFIDHHVAKSYLWKERQKALLARETPPCDVSTCKTCGAC